MISYMQILVRATDSDRRLSYELGLPPYIGTSPHKFYRNDQQDTTV